MNPGITHIAGMLAVVLPTWGKRIAKAAVVVALGMVAIGTSGATDVRAAGLGVAHSALPALAGAEDVMAHPVVLGAAHIGGSRGQAVTRHRAPILEFQIPRMRRLDPPLLPRAALAHEPLQSHLCALVPGRQQSLAAPAAGDCAAFQQSFGWKLAGGSLTDCQFSCVPAVVIAILKARAPPGA